MEGATSIDGAASEQVIGFLFKDRPAIIIPPPPRRPFAVYPRSLSIPTPTTGPNSTFLFFRLFSFLLGQTFALAGSVCFSLIATLVNYQ